MAAGVASGVKKRGKLDLGLLASLRPAASAATFTSNAAAAAPVRLTRDSATCDRLQAVVVNAGNANACTGKQGLADAARMRLLAAQHLRLPVDHVAVASTGVIGVPLDMSKIEPGIAAAAKALKPGGGEHFSQAIRTTDASPKRGAVELELPGGVVRLGAAAKGCGMISPRMATMLCFVTCDAAVPGDAWRQMLSGAVAKSFNRITVDGQESTNDMVVGLANGASGVHLGESGLAGLSRALEAMLLALAVGMVADGEGATKAVRLTVDGARDAGDAERVARAVADSPLVKTAFFGRDANWGRIVQAAGQALAGNGAVAAPDVVYEDLAVRAGRAARRAGRGRAGAARRHHGAARDRRARRRQRRLRLGDRLLQRPHARLRDPQRGVHDMTVKHQKTVRTLLEAMPYIRRFWGATVVVKYGGSAMTSPGLQEQFAEDMVLLRLVGMKPVVVHGGGPAITKHLGRLGMESRFVDGHRVTDEATMEVARMVLVGKVNKEIVGLINRHGGAAVGLSGEDGRLLAAQPKEHHDAAGQEVDLGFVGDITGVNVDVLQLLAEQNIPVVASVGDRGGRSGLQRQRRHRGGGDRRGARGGEDRLPHRRGRHLRRPGRRCRTDLGVRSRATSVRCRPPAASAAA